MRTTAPTPATMGTHAPALASAVIGFLGPDPTFAIFQTLALVLIFALVGTLTLVVTTLAFTNDNSRTTAGDTGTGRTLG